MKKHIFFTITPLLLLLFFLIPSENASAETISKDIMAVTFSDAKQNITLNITCETKKKDNYVYYNFSWPEDSSFRLAKLSGASIQVSIQILNSSLIAKDSLDYTKSVSFNNFDGEINFQYVNSDGELENETLYYPSIFSPKISVESLYVAVPAKGFHPSKNNYITIYTSTNNKDLQLDWNECLKDRTYSIRTRVRILNAKGKYVYQKTSGETASNVEYNSKTNIYSQKEFYKINWDGKASKNNNASLKSGAYVPYGKYTVEVSVLYKIGGVTLQSSATQPLTISKTAPSGTKGVKKAKRIPIYTGNANMDYMAEKMCKAAGVKTSMSDEQKVKKIYHYMTTHFKHVHNTATRKKYYNLTKLKSKIKSFKKSSDKKFTNNKIIYTYLDPWYAQDSMVHRGGVCDNHAAIFMILCNHVGIEAGRCGGYYKNLNGSLAPHAWNYAVVNGKTYYYDVDVEIQNYKNGQGDYYWYKKTLSQARKTHKFIEYSY